ncbi:phospholipase A1 EG1, chloroplastic/mitochondrial-like [Phragmites australis]|uniref:phospholipase A1 EG1, chloroplastic/mitochondrial-like n=1 Tax=Phragmites australis TaxID=29695 RepID=UPI002D78D9CF|nr:phospholipase A1 EG1, chloroplastic/mitochondrial-like [Phragmites australis]
MAFADTLQTQCTLQPATSSRRPRPCARFAAVATRSTAATAWGAAARARAPAASAARMSTRRTASVATMWRQVQGSHDWDGLLEPLHPVVRDEVARYGELVGACYTALDVDPSSARHMCCKYGKERVLQEAGVVGAGYEVTRYIYATPDVGPYTSGRPSWVGYVAVSTDEMTPELGRRDVLVSLRGTVTRAEWTANLMSSLEPARLDACDVRPDVKVESGFLNLYTSSADKQSRSGGMGSCREQLLREVSRLITSFSKDHPCEDMSVTLAGHSMGSALAVLLGYDLAEHGLNRDASGRCVPVTVFSFGGPRVGNAAFKDRCDELGVKALRVANVRDPITMLPGVLLNEGTTGLLGSWGGDRYTHVGVELSLDFLRLHNLGSVHDLGTYVESLKAEETCGKLSNAVAYRRGGVLAKAMEFVAGQRAPTFV